jgi:3-hydroxybutyrate dehydrogenase
MLHGVEPEDSMMGRCAELQSAYGVPVHYVAADLASVAGVEQLVTAAQERLGAVGVLINNAVTRHFAPIEAFPSDAWDRALAVNVSAAFHAVRLLLPGMRAVGWGRIVNMVSVYGQRGTADRVDYVTTKAALIGLTRAIAVETAIAGITCNAVCPGSVSTPGTEVRVAALEAEGLPRAEAVRHFLAGKQPTGRFVDASSVVAAVLFLCGPAGRDVTGTVLPVDGGWLAC